jgi:hypothetical protein
MSCKPNCSCKKSSCKSYSGTDSVIYTGEDLTCTGIDNGDTLTVVLQKLDEKYCEIQQLLENCSTTETTTTQQHETCQDPISSILSGTVTKEVPKPASSCCNNPVAELLNVNK